MSQFLYVIRAPGAGLAKVGMSKDPKARFQGIRGAAMHALELAHVFEFRSYQAASVWEKRLITHANRQRDSGEWVVDDERLVELIAEIPKEHETQKFFRVAHGRHVTPSVAPYGNRKVEEHLLQNPKGTSFSEFRGSFKGGDKSIINARLAEGYGAEDIQAMDGICATHVRMHIDALRRGGKLIHILKSRDFAA